MSHFAVIVVGPNVEAQLAPFDEQGENHFVFVEDDTETLDDLQAKHTKLLAEDEEEDEEQDFDTWLREYHGYVVRDGKVGYMTNPNGHWDWWQVGGRWTGYFPVLPGAASELGSPSLLMRDHKATPLTADVAMVKDINVERARAEAREAAEKRFALWEVAFTEHGRPESWEAMRDAELAAQPDAGRNDVMTAVRKAYGQQPAIVAHGELLRAKGQHILDCPVDALGFDREAYLSACADNALVPYAVVKDGQWHARGKMGWWGMSNDDVDDADWNKQFHALLTDLPPETVLTMVDCHV